MENYEAVLIGGKHRINRSYQNMIYGECKLKIKLEVNTYINSKIN